MFTKTETIDWHAFFNEDKTKSSGNRTVKVIAKVAGAVHVAMMPHTVFAASVTAGESTFLEVLATVLGIADWLCVGIIIFAGTTWMFGNRTKAIEFITGGAIGYVIIRHAIDIRNWLKAL